MNEETDVPREELNRALIDFKKHGRKTAFCFFGYALVSLVLGLCFLFSKDSLVFGAGSPFIVTGLLLLWPAIRLYNLAQSVNSMLKAKEMSSSFAGEHQNRVMTEIGVLLHLRTVATIVLVIGILLLIPACVFHWSDAISSLSIALAVQGGLIAVGVMVTNFWLEIYVNEIQRHLR